MSAMNGAKQYAVNWNNHMNHVRKAFDSLLTNCELTDVILYAEGQKIGAHKMLLSACSTYFKNLFMELPQEHPVIVLKGISYFVLIDILKFIYNGEVSVDSEVFDSFLQTAEFLQISGLTDGSGLSENKLKRSQSVCKDDHKSKKPKKPRSTLNKTVDAQTNDGFSNALDITNCESNLFNGYLDAPNDNLKDNLELTPEIILETCKSVT